MVTTFPNIGEEFEARHLINDADVPLPETVDVLLFHDGEVSGDTVAGDDLAPASDEGDITTEPGGSLYARQTVNLNTTDFNATQDENDDWQLEIGATVEFDLSDSDGSSTETFDAYGVIVEWDQDGDGIDEPHFWWTDTLDQAYTTAEHGTFIVDRPSLARSGQTTP